MQHYIKSRTIQIYDNFCTICILERSFMLGRLIAWVSPFSEITGASLIKVADLSSVDVSSPSFVKLADKIDF
jgi:hypothetical protein